MTKSIGHRAPKNKGGGRSLLDQVLRSLPSPCCVKEAEFNTLIQESEGRLYFSKARPLLLSKEANRSTKLSLVSKDKRGPGSIPWFTSILIHADKVNVYNTYHWFEAKWRMEWVEPMGSPFMMSLPAASTLPSCRRGEGLWNPMQWVANPAHPAVLCKWNIMLLVKQIVRFVDLIKGIKKDAGIVTHAFSRDYSRGRRI